MLEIPIAIGGVGGSGTRVVAGFFQESGYFLGSDLNAPKDNLWYAFLFGRRDILLESDARLQELIGIFFRQMCNPVAFSSDEMKMLQELAQQDRHQHRPDHLQAWSESFFRHAETGSRHSKWGWKVPYTHVLIDRLLEFDKNMKYIHLTRNGLDMAFSRNQNQLGLWGPVYLNRNVEISPADSLSFWCAVHQRTVKISHMFPGRILEVRFEELVRNPEAGLSELAEFTGAAPAPGVLEKYCNLIAPPATLQRYKSQDLSCFRKEDIRYLAAVGYDI